MRFADYQTVINLALDTSLDAIADERELVETLGMRYHHIPVVWEAPTPEDFERYCEVMEAEHGRRVLVHCVIAKRASAFAFLHRVLRLGVPLDEARAELHAVWTPDAVWSEFIAQQLTRTESPQS